MTTPSPAIVLNVYVTNPGQFFACCGLLELASRIDRYAEGWFTPDTFCISGKVSDTIDRFLAADIHCGDADTSPTDTDDDKTGAITIGPPFGLTLGWWQDHNNPDPGAINSRLKTWSAGQKVSDVFECRIEEIKPKRGKTKTQIHGMRGWMKAIIAEQPHDWLRAAMPISKPKSFCYDSRLARNNALDQGHTSGGVIAFSPSVDVLTLVGLQRFRPLAVTTWNCNRYWTWAIPLPVNVAAAAALGYFRGIGEMMWEFPVIRRDSAGKYKLIGNAQPTRRTYV